MSISQPISGHKGRDQWMCALAAASDLSAMAIRLTLRLCVSFNCKTGQCDPGYRTLAEDMAVSERSVFRAIAELEAGGWIAVDRTGGDNTRKNQFTLLIPSAQVTTIVTRSGDNMLSPEKVSVQVTENGGSGDRNRGVQVTDSVSPLKNLRTCEPEERVEDDPRTVRVDRESITNGTIDAEPVPEPLTPPERALERAPRELLDDDDQDRDQPSPPNATPIGAAPDGAQAAFADVRYAWPTDRTDDEGIAFQAFVAALVAARGDTNVVCDAVEELLFESGADPPLLSEALRHIERAQARRTGRQ